MPDILRSPLRMNCEVGLDLVSPIDRMPPGAFPYLFNCRVVQEGRLEARPGYAAFFANLGSGHIHSLRRLNDAVLTPFYSYVVGRGTELYGGTESSRSLLSTGFSGNPLSLITFRPENSPDSWMYVYDSAKQLKLRVDGLVRDIGIAPPTEAPVVEYGPPAAAIIDKLFDSTGWVASGTAGTLSTGDRTAPTMATAPSFNPVYDSGTTGWACLSMLLPDGVSWYANPRMLAILNPGGGNEETVAVREIHPNIFPGSSTTISSIAYDSGSSGLCSIVLVGNPPLVERNTLLLVGAGSEVVRVLSTTLSPDGTTYSIRCSTTLTMSAGDTVSGLICWRVYTIATHSNGETVAIPDVSCTGFATKGVGAIGKGVTLDASETNLGTSGRPIDTANDYMHISVFVQNPANVVTIKIMIDIDNGTAALVDAFKRNYWTWTVTQPQLNEIIGDAGGSWTEVVVPIASGVRSGSDPTVSFATIKALQVEFTATDSIGPVAINAWYFMGTFGPTIIPNSPVGYLYLSRDRDSYTGAASVPGPITRYQLFPLREEILVTPQISNEAGVDSLDIYRQGGTLTDFVYAGTATNDPTDAVTFADTQSDAIIIANPSPDPTLFQPWPVLFPARSGVVNVAGTSVVWVAGDEFDLNLVANTVILINGVVYQTFGQPTSATLLQLTLSAGTQSNVTYVIASPTLAAQPLPYAFGPLEGPFAPVLFALGDTENAGTLYYTNSSNADAAADSNTLEICAPSEPLISGQVWNGLVFVGSRDNLFVVRYSYLTNLTIGVSTGNPIVYQFTRIPAPSGMWSTWATCRGPNGVYFLGRDGIYMATDSGAVSITDATLYPLFPHDGQAAIAINLGGNVIEPVDMTDLANLRLSACDFDIYFDYTDMAGSQITLRYEIEKKRWFHHVYNDRMTVHYLVEPSASAPNNQSLLLASRDAGIVFESGGDDDNDTTLTSQFLTPSLDGGDERAQKLYVDLMVDADQSGTLTIAPFFTDAQTAGGVLDLTLTGSRVQSLENIASLSDLALYRNIALKAVWTGGPSGPRVYAFEPSGYSQPYLSNRIVTQFGSLSFSGAWKHHRRCFGAIIGTADLTIVCQDGRTFGPYGISSPNQYRVIDVMLDQDIKDLAFAYQLEGPGGSTFALFPNDFVIEVKEWTEPSYIKLAVFRA